MIGTFMVGTVTGTTHARIEHKSGKIACHQILDIARATTHDLDIVGLERIFGTLTHRPGQHNLYAHLLQTGSYTRLAAATLR